MKYQFIATQQPAFAVSVLCAALDVSVSGYYAWRHRIPSRRCQADAALLEPIHRAFVHGRGVYGSPRVHALLRQEGVRCGRKRVARLMRAQGLCVRSKPHRTRTTDSQHAHPVAPNQLNQEFSAQFPNQKWVGDMTAIWTREGWVYLAALVDLYSRMVVGWALGATRDARLVEAALQLALARRQPRGEGLLHHTDRGSQYTSATYRAQLHAANITVSMSRKGNCYDNAVMESFFGTLKAECVDLQACATRAQARTVIFEYIEVFYNRQRLHSSLGYLSPMTFEHQPPRD